MPTGRACGHIGTSAVRAVQLAPDMNLAGIIELDCRLTDIHQRFPEVPFYSDFHQLPEKPDVIITCVPTRGVEASAADILSAGISTVDCFDMHGDAFVHLKETLEPLAKNAGSKAVMGAGLCMVVSRTSCHSFWPCMESRPTSSM